MRFESYMSDFKDKRVAITGGTGSFGSEFVEFLTTTEVSEVLILSRDESKQDLSRVRFKDDRISYKICDVRDFDATNRSLKGVDFVFHAAALKQVPACEFNAMEAVKTNILGSNNVINACVDNNISKAVMLSTDKAVQPVNAMGMSKAMMEKIAIGQAFLDNKTVFSVTRYGNVMGSRGSVIPIFVDKILKGEELLVTDPNMTRFMMSLQESVDLVVYALINSMQGELLVQKAPAATLEVLVAALELIFNTKANVRIIGPRHAEKTHEVLLSSEESARAVELDGFYKVSPDTRGLDYSSGTKVPPVGFEFNSSNTLMLSPTELADLLIKLPFMSRYIDASI